MKHERTPTVTSGMAVIAVAAVWLWLLFAYADLVFRP
jgi:hypothetical protein